MCEQIVAVDDLNQLLNLKAGVDKVQISNSVIIEYLCLPEKHKNPRIDAEQLRHKYIIGLRKSYKKKIVSASVLFSRNDIEKICGENKCFSKVAY